MCTEQIFSIFSFVQTQKSLRQPNLIVRRRNKIFCFPCLFNMFLKIRINALFILYITHRSLQNDFTNFVIKLWNVQHRNLTSSWMTQKYNIFSCLLLDNFIEIIHIVFNSKNTIIGHGSELRNNQFDFFWSAKLR